MEDLWVPQNQKKSRKKYKTNNKKNQTLSSSTLILTALSLKPRTHPTTNQKYTPAAHILSLTCSLLLSLFSLISHTLSAPHSLTVLYTHTSQKKKNTRYTLTD